MKNVNYLKKKKLTEKLNEIKNSKIYAILEKSQPHQNDLRIKGSHKKETFEILLDTGTVENFCTKGL